MKRRRRLKRLHVGPVLLQGHRRFADVLVRLEKENGAGTSGVGDAVAIRRAPVHCAAHDLYLVLREKLFDCRLDDWERQREALSDFMTGQVARKMERLDDKLNDQIEVQPRLLQGRRRGRNFGDGHQFSRRHRWAPGDQRSGRRAFGPALHDRGRRATWA